jgi:hypothetical protein
MRNPLAPFLAARRELYGPAKPARIGAGIIGGALLLVLVPYIVATLMFMGGN